MKMNKEFVVSHKQQIVNWCTLAVWAFVCVGTIIGMLLFASGKTIVIADSASEGALGEGALLSQEQGRQLEFRFTYQEENRFLIPLPHALKAEGVIVENRYREKQLWIYLRGVAEEDFKDAVIEGRTSVVELGRIESWGEGVVLKLQMTGIYEYRSTLNDQRLAIGYYDPHQLYETVIVVDASGGGTDTGVGAGALWEKNVTLELAQRLQQQFSHDKIKLFFTRLEDKTLSYEERAKLVSDINADAFISMSLSAHQDAQEYGISGYYNAQYVIPDYGNPQVADVLTRNVTVAASNRALGLFPVTEEHILSLITVPAAQVSVGCVGNEQEMALLEQEAYLDKLVTGFQAAILELHDRLHVKQE